ncbi:FAD-dependent oxidoreductase [Flexivirga caeni]|uniref:FAD-dependent oxidoreductase n=1 Tax=Flexivirga caeni TaxID=2294115 RepID=A0A3M9M6V6_9MICO|nr:FAD-dependent oxidoreductase [Flexivirga caeni]RNI21314.1 FAD-dependent oxidoreductase [Flexivirga caeni]
MNASFPNLFSPLHIGPVTLPNRIVSSAHDTVMTQAGQVTDQLVAYHTARAAGGVGLIVIQAAGVHESARYTSHVLMASDDSCIDGYRRIAEAVHEHGTRVFGQLFHPGREVMDRRADGSAQAPVAPSPVPQERFHVMPRQLRTEEITDIVHGYAAAATRLADAGLDGVEIVASHGYLPAQFLNPHANLRADAYGGSPENRARFVRDVAEAVRTAVGERVAVGLRLSIGEHDPAGLDKATALDACARLAADGVLDYVSVTVGTSASLAGSDHIVPDMTWSSGYVVPEAREVREVVRGLPVLVAGRINQPQEAERILAAGDADACIMTRALISDPTMPSLAREGRTEDIRACIGCNQACIGHFHLGYPISCIQRPETGRELEYGAVRRAARVKNVLVIGGGPAGMKAAVIAAQRGHRVRLVEAGARCGGQVLLAQELPGRAEFGGAATNLRRELDQAGVDVILRQPADLAFVEGARADSVIVATGATPYRPDLEIGGGLPVLDAWQVIGGERPPPGLVVVTDWRGDWIGIGLARMLAIARHRVVLAVNGHGPGEFLQQYVRDQAVAALVTAGITVLPLVRPYGVDDDSIYLQHTLTGEPVIVDEASALVLAYGHTARRGLLEELLARGIPATGIGDCVTPRTVEEAVLEGLETASSL